MYSCTGAIELINILLGNKSGVVKKGSGTRSPGRSLVCESFEHIRIVICIRAANDL